MSLNMRYPRRSVCLTVGCSVQVGLACEDSPAAIDDRMNILVVSKERSCLMSDLIPKSTRSAHKGTIPRLPNT
jgi:hypothetical protein